MYVRPNFKTKKELKKALKRGDNISVFAPGVQFQDIPRDGTVYLEGPHAPAMHTWYAQGKMVNGILKEVR